MPLTPVDNNFSYKRILLMPLRGTILLTMLGLAILFFISDLGGIFGLWLKLVTFIATLSYAQVVVEKTIYGYKEPPPLSPKQFTVSFNTAGFGLYALFIILALVGHFFVAQAGSAALYAYLALVVFCLPAMLAATVLENSLSTALNPVALSKIIKAIGPRYLSVFAIVAFGYVLSTLIANKIDLPLINTATGLYGLFLLCCAVGRLVFVSRVELSLNITSRDEARAQEDRQHLLNQDNIALNEALQKSRLSPIEAAEGLWAYHERANSSSSRLFECFDALGKWPNPNTALRFSQPFARYLVAANSKDNAIEVVQWCMATEPEFRLADADTTYSLGVYAASIAQFKLAAFILQDMGKRYPEDPNTIAALVTTGKIAAQKLNDIALLKNVVAQLSALGIQGQDPRLAMLTNLLDESGHKGP